MSGYVYVSSGQWSVFHPSTDPDKRTAGPIKDLDESSSFWQTLGKKNKNLKRLPKISSTNICHLSFENEIWMIILMWFSSEQIQYTLFGNEICQCRKPFSGGKVAGLKDFGSTRHPYIPVPVLCMALQIWNYFYLWNLQLSKAHWNTMFAQSIKSNP